MSPHAGAEREERDTVSLSPQLQRSSFQELPGWQEDKGISAALDAFSCSARRVRVKPYRSGALGLRLEAFGEAFDRAAGIAGPVSDAQARMFFEQFFVPYCVMPEAGARSLVTGYYEPVAEASLVRTDEYLQPLYRQPDDLMEIEDPASLPGWDPSFRFGRKTADGFEQYFDRGEIDRGALEGRGLELCWLKDRVDTFFIHVQGAARLKLADGSHMRVTYAAKTGHPFTGIGRVLADMGEIPLAEVTMQSIRRWLAEHPERMDEVLWQNRSYIFFRETEPGDPALGPVAAAKVQLTPGRSIAVDRLLHTFGTPLFISSPGLEPVFGEPFQRLMIAQDTGSAILGAARADLFIGTGQAAGEIAGVIKHDAAFFVLVPRSLAGES